MNIITADRFAEIVEYAPALALVGLTVPKEPLREAARHELAEHLYASLYGPAAGYSTQLALPLA